MLAKTFYGSLSRWCAVVFVALVAVMFFVGFFGTVHHDVGPAKARLWLSLHPRGETGIDQPLLGSLTFDTHDSPIRLNLQAERIPPDDVAEAFSQPNPVETLKAELAQDMREATTQLIVRDLKLAAAGIAIAGIFGLVMFGPRFWRSTLLGVAAVVLMLGAVAGAAKYTFESNSFSEPQYEGPLSAAPMLMEKAEKVITDFGSYSGELQQQLAGIQQLYQVATNLPASGGDEDAIKVLHVSDLHFSRHLGSFELMRQVAEQYNVDMVVDSGDITLLGNVENQFLDGIGTFDVPYVYVKGNHDSEATVEAIKRYDNAVVLNYDTAEVAGLTLAGAPDPTFTAVKPEEPPASEQFIQSGELLKLALQRKSIEADVAVMHNPKSAEPLAGEVPLVLSGHTHNHEVRQLDDGTTLFVQGSTGGGGLRGAKSKTPPPIEMSVLSFDPESKQLTAYDHISIGTLGERSVNIERHVVETEERSEKTPQAAAN